MLQVGPPANRGVSYRCFQQPPQHPWAQHTRTQSHQDPALAPAAQGDGCPVCAGCVWGHRAVPSPHSPLVTAALLSPQGVVLPPVARGAEPHVLPLRVCGQEQLLPADQPGLLHQPRPPHLLPLHRPLHRHGERPGRGAGEGTADETLGWCPRCGAGALQGAGARGAAPHAAAVLGRPCHRPAPLAQAGAAGHGLSVLRVLRCESREWLWGRRDLVSQGLCGGDGSRSLAATPGVGLQLWDYF